MSSVTPSFTIDVSSSLIDSSKVKPYWNPEQPPPLTKTRNLRSGFPSSVMRSFTLAAAASVNISGAGISVGAFIHEPLIKILGNYLPVSRCGQPDQKSIRRCRGPERKSGLPSRILFVHESALDDRSELNLQRPVVHISGDFTFGLQFH